MALPKHEALPPGTRVATRYRVEQLLGMGGMGAVYSVFDEELGRHVALKLLLTEHAGRSETVERFEREARAAAGIPHPGVVEVYDRGTDGGLLFVVMERLQGQSLEKRIADAAPLPAPFVARVGADLSSAVAAAHARGIIHRDLKPSNVFLADTGDSYDVVKVLDFGVAKLRARPGLTQSHQVFGTLAYMPPEQLQSAAHVTAASDVYAMGCILYEMLTRHRPYEAQGYAALTLAVLNDPFTPLSTHRKDIPASLRAVIERALQKQPARRFRDAGEMGDALFTVAEELGEIAAKRRRPSSARPSDGSQPQHAPGPERPAHQADGLAHAPTLRSAESPVTAQHTDAASPHARAARDTRPAVNVWDVAGSERPPELESRAQDGRSRASMLAIAAGVAIAVIVVAGLALR